MHQQAEQLKNFASTYEGLIKQSSFLDITAVVHDFLVLVIQ